MLKILSVLGFGLAATISMATASHAADNPYSCNVVDLRFVCADGEKNTGVVSAAMANPVTIENINKQERGDRLLADPVQRELYRRSVERAHKRIRQHVDRMQRRYKRRRLSEDDWEFMKQRYEIGLKTYHAAMSLYHAKEWFSETIDEQAEGDELKQSN